MRRLAVLVTLFGLGFLTTGLSAHEVYSQPVEEVGYDSRPSPMWLRGIFTARDHTLTVNGVPMKVINDYTQRLQGSVVVTYWTPYLRVVDDLPAIAYLDQFQDSLLSQAVDREALGNIGRLQYKRSFKSLGSQLFTAFSLSGFVTGGVFLALAYDDGSFRFDAQEIRLGMISALSTTLVSLAIDNIRVARIESRIADNYSVLIEP